MGKNKATKIIRLSESDLKDIIEKVLSEQSNLINPNNAPSDYLGTKGSLGAQQKKQVEVDKVSGDLNSCCPCVPKQVRFLVIYVQKHKDELMKQMGVDEKTLLFILKAALGTIGRETSFAVDSEFTDRAAEFLGLKGLGKIVELGQAAYNFVKRSDSQPSLGASQFTKDTWNKYGLDKSIGDFYHSTGVAKSGLGAMFRLLADYRKAKQMGLKSQPSVNPIAVRQKKISSIDGTGDNAWDLAIVAHNFGPGMITTWCTTSSPDYAAPCSQSTYRPNGQGKEPELKVNQNQVIPNYFPNKSSGALRSIGYVEEVAGYIKKFDCISL